MSKKPKVVYSKRAGPKQRAWLQNYYDQTGFDALYQEDFDARKITFLELVRANIDWYESHSNATMRAIEWRP